MLPFLLMFFALSSTGNCIKATKTARLLGGKFCGFSSSSFSPLFGSGSLPRRYPSNIPLLSPPKTSSAIFTRNYRFIFRKKVGCTYSTHSHSTMAEAKLASLRGILKQRGLDATIVLSYDDHCSEYVAAHDKRREFISNFTGSAGTALITMKEALLWTDGRYFKQAESELDPSCWQLMKQGVEGTKTLSEWLASSDYVKKVGLSAFQTPMFFFNAVKNALTDKGVELIPLNHSLVDEIWGESQPDCPNTAVYVHHMKYAGQSVEDKIKNTRLKMKEKGVSCLLLSALDEVAWFLNLRGSDIEYSPIFVSYCLVEEKSVTLFVSAERLQDEAVAHLEACGVAIRPYNEVLSAVTDIFQGSDDSSNPCTHKIWLDSDINMAIYHAVKTPEKKVLLASTPVMLAKSIKNVVELAGMKEAHIQDAVAEVKFLHKLDSIAKSDELYKYDEVTISDVLENFRAQQPDFVGLSFATISGIGPNGAIVHYKANIDSCAKLSQEMYLVDSGGQYLCGTTDVTRTVHLGSPTDYEKECWTRVLKGHIALARAVFPKGTKGPQLDCLARQFLWRSGKDYLHGTGHGVGSFLGVHEKPCSISSAIQSSYGQFPFEPGMVMSNEPGYYGEKFGIRIENLVAVVVADELPPNPSLQSEPFYKFETITLIPLQKKLIDVSMLSAEEVEWVDSYHQRIFEVIGARLKAEGTSNNAQDSSSYEWLRMATSPLQAVEIKG